MAEYQTEKLSWLALWWLSDLVDFRGFYAIIVFPFVNQDDHFNSVFQFCTFLRLFHSYYFIYVRHLGKNRSHPTHKKIFAMMLNIVSRCWDVCIFLALQVGEICCDTRCQAKQKDNDTLLGQFFFIFFFC